MLAGRWLLVAGLLSLVTCSGLRVTGYGLRVVVCQFAK